ncbi:riboflavin synthase subunit alpha [Buchnera aphidicola]|uniref:riboflavin synthase subunit alpha n=1 Tax=Buchnera aphidicola TaxID=9 RepID=UPI00346493EE
MEFPCNLLFNLKIGDSISNNGCCLTVVKILNNLVYFDIVKSTLKITNFYLLSVGLIINIERALKFGDEIGGHLVSGHITNTAIVCDILHSKNNKKIYFKPNDISIMRYIFSKGFITIDGVSLTVYDILKDMFSVYFIPETLLKTNLSHRIIGDIVNIEVDYYTKIIVDQVKDYSEGIKKIV